MSRGLWPWLIVLALTLVIAPWIALQAGTETGPLEREARAIERSLRCPVCEGQSVADSNSSVALEMREEIREMLAQGKTRDEILQYYVNRYGEWILYMPPPRGVFLLGWFLPFLAVAAGGWVVYRWLRARAGTEGTRSPASARAAPAPEDGTPGEDGEGAGDGVDWQRELSRWM
ncbi:MAG: cytochrome c-type biogenesis protein CcmH [Symbiobacteriaceae bacterium]